MTCVNRDGYCNAPPCAIGPDLNWFTIRYCGCYQLPVSDADKLLLKRLEWHDEDVKEADCAAPRARLMRKGDPAD